MEFSRQYKSTTLWRTPLNTVTL